MTLYNQIKEAVKVDMVEYLSKNGFDPVEDRVGRKRYISPLRNESSGSFFLRRGLDKWLWRDYGLNDQKQYQDILDFVMRFSGVNKPTAVDIILGNDLPTKNFHQSVEDNIPYYKVIVDKEVESGYLQGYLKDRAIGFDLAKLYCRELHITWPKSKNPMKIYKVIGWKTNKGGWEARNTFIKSTLTPSSFSYIKGNNDTVLFEGFMDFLSALMYFKIDRFDESVVVLNGNGNWLYAEDKLRGGVVYSYLDNNKGGSDLTEDLLSVGISLVDRRSLFYGYDDFNDFLIDEGKRTYYYAKLKSCCCS